jgi:hypothetical protein
MTIRLLKSQIDAIGFDFEAEVVNHIKNLEAHRFTQGTPAPAGCHPVVELAVKRVQYPVAAELPDEFVPDYVIEDDTPAPAPEPMPVRPSLDERKLALAAQVHQEEHRIGTAAWPLLRRRLDVLRAHEAIAQGDLASEEAKSFARDIAAKEAFLKAIERRGAELLYEIDGLTEETVDLWQMTGWPG